MPEQLRTCKQCGFEWRTDWCPLNHCSKCGARDYLTEEVDGEYYPDW